MSYNGNLGLAKNAVVKLAKGPVAAGTTDITDAAIVDMQGFEVLNVICAFGTLTASAVTSFKVQEGDASDLTGASDLSGASVTVAQATGSNKLFVLTCRPTKRYARVVIDRGTANAVLDYALYVVEGPMVKPTALDSSVIVATEAA